MAEGLEQRMLLGADSPTMTPIGQWGGAITDVETLGTTAYATQGQNLVVLDVANPQSPREIGRLFLPSVPGNLSISGNTVYIADEASGLCIIDVSNPSTPVLVARYDTSGDAGKVRTSGAYAFVCVDENEMQIIDINTVNSPQLVGIYTTAAGNVLNMCVEGNYAYLAESLGMEIVDISQVSSPSLAGTYNTMRSIFAVDVSGSYAYISEDAGGLRVLNINDPSALSTVGSYAADAGNVAIGVSVAGDYAYLADGYGGLVTIDISDPASPALASTYGYAAAGHNASGVSIAGSLAYVPVGDDGMQIINVSDPTALALAGAYNPRIEARAVRSAGSLVVVDDADYDLRIFDVSNPAAPMLVGSFALDEMIYGMDVVGNYVYVANGYSGVRIIDLSDPAHPTLATTFATLAANVSIEGSKAYVVAHEDGLQILDLSDPASPVLVGEFDTSADARNVWVEGSRAYVTTDTGLQIIDVAQSDEPRLIGRYAETGMMQATVAGDYVYMLGGNMDIIDIRKPSHPRLVSQYPRYNNASDFAVAGNFVYIANGNPSVEIINIADPSHPVTPWTQYSAGNLAGISLAGNIAYLAEWHSGLVIAEVQDLTRGSFGTIDGKRRTVSLQDADGDTVTFSLSGGGFGVVAGTGDSFRDVQMWGTTATSKLQITVKRSKGSNSDGQALMGNIMSDSLMSKITAPAVFLTGNMDLDGLGDSPGKTKLTIGLGGVVGGAIRTGILPVKLLKVLDWGDTPAATQTLVAPWADSIVVTGRKVSKGVAGLPGNFDASTNLRQIGSLSVAGTIAGTVHVDGPIGKITAGAVTGTIVANGAGIGSVKVLGTVSGARIATSGSMDSFSAAGLSDSAIIVGAGWLFIQENYSYARSSDDFDLSATVPAKLGSLTITGHKPPKGQVAPAFVQNSHISAPSFGNISLVNAPADTGKMLHVLSDTGMLKIAKWSDGMLPSGQWTGGEPPQTGQPQRPDIVEVVT